MKFGQRVYVLRGSKGRQGPGALREVLGVLVGAKGNERWVRLLEDDKLDTVGWNKRGMIGRWSKSVVRAEKSC